MANHTQTIEQGAVEAQNALIEASLKAHTDENLGFLWSVLHARRLAAGNGAANIPIKIVQIGGRVPPEQQGSQNTVGQWIYKTYVDSSSPREINLPADERKVLEAAKQSNSFTPGSFAAAYATIMGTVNGATGN